MSWVMKNPLHYCNPPRGGRKRDWGAGSVWQCDECGARHEWYENWVGAGWRGL